MTYIDLSHVLHDGLVTYKGLPAFHICDYLSREDSRQYYDHGTEFQIGKIEMVTNTGTYIDCPFHRYPDGKDFSMIPIAELSDVPGVVIEAKDQAIGPEVFRGRDLRGKAVLVKTRWSRNFGTPAYFEGHPFLTESAAVYLEQQNVRMVGIDSHNIDDTRTKSRPVHSHLLRHQIYIIEHLTNLDALPPENFLFTALPPAIRGAGTFPVRAHAKIP